MKMDESRVKSYLHNDLYSVNSDQWSWKRRTSSRGIWDIEFGAIETVETRKDGDFGLQWSVDSHLKMNLVMIKN